MKTRNCQLCGTNSELTFEHIPPKAAFNRSPILVQYHAHLIESSNPKYGKYDKSQKGFGGYTLCRSCNNNTGAWYANEYADFAIQGMNIMANHKPQYWVEGSFKIKPLNVFKQVLTMFMSADKSTSLQSQQDLVDFLLNRDSKQAPDRYKVYLYASLSKYSRLIGYSRVFDPGNTMKVWSEINFKPFGFLLAVSSPPADRDQVDISYFKDYDLNEEATVTLKLPYLDVRSPEIGRYAFPFPRN